MIEAQLNISFRGHPPVPKMAALSGSNRGQGPLFSKGGDNYGAARESLWQKMGAPRFPRNPGEVTATPIRQRQWIPSLRTLI